jgi:hypothetical protein
MLLPVKRQRRFNAGGYVGSECQSFQTGCATEEHLLTLLEAELSTTAL